MKTILVTGGAGYIGSHTARMLEERGYKVIVFDSLEHGHKWAVSDNAVFYKGDLRNKADIQTVFQEHDIAAVLHFAAFALVGESMSNPAKYFENNVYGTLNFLAAVRKA